MQCNIIFLQQPYSPGIFTSRACESCGLNTTGCFNDKGQDWHALTVQRYSISNKTSSSRLHSTSRSQHSKQATSTSKTSETGNNPNSKTKLHKKRIVYQNSSKPAQRNPRYQPGYKTHSSNEDPAKSATILVANITPQR